MYNYKIMRILAIETSCDETAVTLMDISGKPNNPKIVILGNSLMSQIHIHKDYGGVYPMLAKREHEINLPPLLNKTLSEAGENPKKPNIDLVSVTEGPGLEPALWVGITFAERLAKERNKPLLPVNHMEGHIYSVLYQEPRISNFQFSISKELELPALALLVSGGHTELVHIEDFGKYKILGKTRDDAVGEAFDKVARLLGLPYPGGPKISVLAGLHRSKGLTPSFEFPRPIINSGDLDFSFSGLKTAVLYKIKNLDLTKEETKEEVARAFEDAAIETLVSKTKKALEKNIGIKTLIAAGGVAANSYLRFSLLELMKSFPDITLLFPEKELATDNAVMIGIAAYIKSLYQKEVLLGDIRARGNLSL